MFVWYCVFVLKSFVVLLLPMFSSIEFWVKTPTWAPKIIKQAVWKIPTEEKILYLTFDDGPIPVVTPWVLDQLKEYNAKATFFLIGERIEKYPETFQLLIENKHQIGNHTYNHLDAWKTGNRVYYENVEKADQVITSLGIDSPLLRPPYGKLSIGQYNYLKKRYQLIMWDVVPGDFLPKVDGEECFKRIKKYAGPGSIIVLHDSKKCFETIKVCLPMVLKHYSELGYSFKAIDPNSI